MNLHNIATWWHSEFVWAHDKFWNIRGLGAFFIETLISLMLVRYTPLLKKIPIWSHNVSLAVHKWTTLHKSWGKVIAFIIIVIVLRAIVAFASWQASWIIR